MELHLQLLCRELSKQIEVKVIVANHDGPTRNDADANVQITRLSTAIQIAGASVCPRMVGAIRDSAADIVHIHLPNPPAALAYLASGHPGKLVATWHLDIVRQRALGGMFRPVSDLLLRRSSAIVVTSPDYLRSSRHLQNHRDRCYVIPYGIPVDSFATADPDQVLQLRARYGERVVLAIGRFVYYKGFAHLIAAMAQVEATLLLIGDGPLRPDLERLARDAGVADRVVFLGAIPNTELAAYYHAADVFALPSVARSEAFGIVQIEAMAAGTPVVNTRLDSGVPFVSLDGITGLTVPPADSRALARAITSLLDDSAWRAQLGNAGIQRARTEFSVTNMVARVMTLYSAVTSERLAA
jgi:rhamnosyl/mannosyltransferase